MVRELGFLISFLLVVSRLNSSRCVTAVLQSELDIEAVLYGALLASLEDRDLIAVALNERFSELGGDHPIGYSTDPQDA